MAAAAEDADRLLAAIRQDVIGDELAIHTPYGWRRLTYADHTASGRALGSIENAIRDDVLPTYANTHTQGSHTGRRTTQLREQAREVIRQAAGGDDGTAVIFCGSGSTAAVDKLIRILGLQAPRSASPGHRAAEPVVTRASQADRPIVFVGPYEHHSNELPWRESIADVVVIPLDAHGGLDLAQLERELRNARERPLRIGSFSAASNVTGVITDVPAVTALLHGYGALSCWDFAAAAPHLPIDMVPSTERPPVASEATGWGRASGDTAKDAVFLSPHKLPGGPGTPGILLIRRDLVRNPVPTAPGGGTVSFVGLDSHRYVDDVEEREEAGTPAIVGAVRAGLAFRLRQRVGVEVIQARERVLVRRLLRSLAADPGIELLGDVTRERIGVVSLLVRDSRGGPGCYLHHDFVVAVLSDLFGIQARGGCSCAGPYGHRLLGIDQTRSRCYEAQLEAGYQVLKPGWVRLSLAYYMSDAVLEYLCEALHLVAATGYRLLPDYDVDLRSGTWRHRAGTPGPAQLPGLELLAPRQDRRPRRLPEAALIDHVQEARRLLAARPEPPPPEPGSCRLPPEAEALRWFALPPPAAPYAVSEASAAIGSGQ